MDEIKINWKVKDWLPCTKEQAQDKTPSFGRTSTTTNPDGLIDSILTTGRNLIIISVCSERYKAKQIV